MNNGIDRVFIEKATDNFLKQGGKITICKTISAPKRMTYLPRFRDAFARLTMTEKINMLLDTKANKNLDLAIDKSSFMIKL
jgi:hypothetical protein